jgi:predicted Zn-dependent protease
MRSAQLAAAIFLAVAAYIPTSAVAQDGPGAAIVERRALDHATRLEQAGREDEAMRALENLLDEQPHSVSALVYLSQLAQRAGAPERALLRAEAAASSDDSGLPALRQVWIRTLQAAGLQDSALNVTLSWIEEQPAEASAYRELSGLWARSGNTGKAIEALETGRVTIGSRRLFVQELAALHATRGAYGPAAREWRAMLAWGDPGVEAVERRITDPTVDRPVALEAVRKELSSSESTMLERKGALDLALRLGEFAWARDIVAGLSADLPELAARDVLRDYVERARDAGDLEGAAWAAELLVLRADTDEEVIYWLAFAADLSYEAGDLEGARAGFENLLAEAAPGSDLYELSLQRLHELAASGDPDRTERLLREHVALYPDRRLASVRMSVRSAGAWLTNGRLDRARSVIELVPPADAEQAALQGAVLGRLEILAGRPTAARGHLELAAAVPAGDAGARILALELLAIVEQADSSEIAALGSGIVAATASSDPGPLLESVSRWSARRMPGGEGMASFAAQELYDAGEMDEARTIRVTIVEEWSGSPEAPRALLELARADHPENPTRAADWLERLVVEYPESAMAPIARRLLAEWGARGRGATGA